MSEELNLDASEGSANRPKSRRAGGRAARISARSAPLPESQRPIWPGLKGGQFRPLSEHDVQRIHEAALDALEVIGLAQAPDSGIEIMTKAGAILGDDGRLRYPRALVEDMLDKATKQLTLFGRDPKHDLELGPNKVYFGTAGAAVHLVDPQTRDYRLSTTKDLYEAACLVQALDNVHFFQRNLVCRELQDMLELDINTVYASMSGTKKHIGTSISDPNTFEATLDVIHHVAGGEEAFRKRPFISNSNCFVVPPMKFATESCMTLEKVVRAGMPILLLSAGQAGATAPASIPLTIVQAVAECLAGVVYVNAISPGHPAVFGTWPFVSDLRTGAMSGGSAEQALLTAGCAQMHAFYGLPGGAASGISDSKLPDMQAGWEQGITNVLAGLSGLNLCYESVGMHASLLGFCPESAVLGNEVLGQALRCVRGIEVNDESISIETIRSVCLEGPGHYLGSEQTLKLMQSEYVYPEIGNRMSPNEWEDAKKPDLLESARLRKEAILAAAECQIDPAVDAAIRSKFPIRFDNGRLVH